tara:strand:+ start:126 stop:380 length:255 start_codon:yes stop_codon:yes gene_type:complete
MNERYFILSLRKLHNSKRGHPRWKFVAVDRHNNTLILTTKADEGWVYKVTDKKDKSWKHRMIQAITHTTTRNTIVDEADLAEVF